MILDQQNSITLPKIRLFEGAGLMLGRVHEFCGPSRVLLAAVAAAQLSGPVAWIRPGWVAGQISPYGLSAYMDPGRIIYMTPRNNDDLLWCMAETLRSGVLATVVVELPEPTSLTPVRRLNLAAQTGAGSGKSRPLPLILTPGDGGAQGVESRWHISPARAPQPAWNLARTRSRSAPETTWQADHNDEMLCIIT